MNLTVKEFKQLLRGVADTTVVRICSPGFGIDECVFHKVNVTLKSKDSLALCIDVETDEDFEKIEYYAKEGII